MIMRRVFFSAVNVDDMAKFWSYGPFKRKDICCSEWYHHHFTPHPSHDRFPNVIATWCCRLKSDSSKLWILGRWIDGSVSIYLTTCALSQIVQSHNFAVLWYHPKLCKVIPPLLTHRASSQKNFCPVVFHYYHPRTNSCVPLLSSDLFVTSFL